MPDVSTKLVDQFKKPIYQLPCRVLVRYHVIWHLLVRRGTWGLDDLDRPSCRWRWWFRSSRKMYFSRVRSPHSRSRRVACCWRIHLLNPSRRNPEAPKSPTWRATVDVWCRNSGICIVWGSSVLGYTRDWGKRDGDRDFYIGSGPWVVK